MYLFLKSVSCMGWVRERERVSFYGLYSLYIMCTHVYLHIHPPHTDLGLSENSVPLNPMVNDHYPVFKWLFHWEYTLYSDKPICFLHRDYMTQRNHAGPRNFGVPALTKRRVTPCAHPMIPRMEISTPILGILFTCGFSCGFSMETNHQRCGNLCIKQRFEHVFLDVFLAS